MKIIFLDIDGVLNSAKYDRSRGADDGNIDKSRLSLLKELTDASGAKIILSSSWRMHWSKENSECGIVGRELNKIFAESGLEIYGKTPELSSFDRPAEIRAWLENASREGKEIKNFAIIDDFAFGWGELQEKLVLTNYMIGYGLEPHHIEKAKELLK